MKFNLNPASCAVLLAVCVSAHSHNVYAKSNAQTGASASDSLEVITVTANRYQSSLSDSLSNQTVITSNDIAALNASSLGEVLTTVAGFDLSQTGGRGQNASLFLRGNNASHTLFLLNGVKLTSATLGLAEFQKLSVANIEQIEIIKGPRAAVWGSEAIAGVVNIVTKSNPGTTSLSAKVGSFNTKQLTFSSTVEHGDGQSTILFDHEQSDGFDVLGESAGLSESDEDGYRYNTLSINGEQNISSSLQASWMVNLDRGQNDYDSLFGGADQAKHKNQQLALGLDYSLKDNDLKLDVNRLVDDASTYYVEPSSNQVQMTSQIKTQRDTLSISNLYSANSALSVFAGVDLGKEKVEGQQSFSQDERQTTAAFIQTSYDLTQWQLEGALRYDDIEDIDSELTYNLAIGYQAAQTGLTLNVGTGFKAPTFNDLYWPAGPYSKGNPDLVSERSRNIELTAFYQLSNAKVQLSLYQNKVDDLIEWQPDADFVYQPQNVNSATIKGLEIDANVSYSDVRHSLNLTLLDPVNDQTGETLTLRAKTRVNYVGSMNLTDAISTTLRASYVSSREQKSWDGSTTRLDSYIQTDINAHYQFDSSINFGLGIKDVFDQQEPSAIGYEVAGRRAYVSANITF